MAVDVLGDFLAISGSLRRDSINSAALRAAARAAARGRDDQDRRVPADAPTVRSRTGAVAPGGGAPVQERLRRCVRTAPRRSGVHVRHSGSPEERDRLDGRQRLPLPEAHRAAPLAPPGRGAHAREALAHVLRAHNAEICITSCRSLGATETRAATSRRRRVLSRASQGCDRAHPFAPARAMLRLTHLLSRRSGHAQVERR